MELLMEKTSVLIESSFPKKKKKQHDISREDLARAMDTFKNAGGKITVIEHPVKKELI
jgi:hypothetical protein